MSLKPYSEYKDSGVEWLGVIPSHWVTEPLKRSTYIKARVGWKGLTSDEYLESSDAYLVTGTDFNGRYIEWESCHQVDFERYQDDPYIQLQNGDLLMTKDGTIGKLAVVSGLDKPACLNSGIFLLRPEKSYSTEYLYWVLSSDVFRQFVELTSYGSTIKHLYQNVLVDFAFGVPSESEQRAITNFLDHETAEIDAFIADQERLIELLEERRVATIVHAVTKGLDPAVPMKDSGLEWIGERPVSWKIAKLRYLASVGTGSSDTVDATDDGDYTFFVRSQTPERIGHYSYDTEAVLTAGDGAGVGRVFHHFRGKFEAHQRVYVIQDFVNVKGRYIYYFMSALFGPLVLAGTAKSTVESLRRPMLTDFHIALPPENEQEAIVSFLDSETSKIDAAVGDAREAIALSRERRAALISAAVTGQVDVSQSQSRGSAGEVLEQEVRV